jgi:hypothetical protein
MHRPECVPEPGAIADTCCAVSEFRLSLRGPNETKAATPIDRTHSDFQLAIMTRSFFKEAAPGRAAASRADWVLSGSFDGHRLGRLGIQRLGIRSNGMADDFNAARLHSFRHPAHQVDMEETILEGGSVDLDIVCKAEMPLEAARGNGLIDVVLLRVVAPTARYYQPVLVSSDGDLLRVKPARAIETR